MQPVHGQPCPTKRRGNDDEYVEHCQRNYSANDGSNAHDDGPEHAFQPQRARNQPADQGPHADTNQNPPETLERIGSAGKQKRTTHRAYQLDKAHLTRIGAGQE